MNRTRSIRAAAVAAAALLAADAAAVNFPLGTFIYAGCAMNYRHEVLTEDDGVTVQAIDTNGVVLASCRVGEADETGVNFLLEVPVASAADGRAAAIGDELTCVVVAATGATSVSRHPLPPVAAANAVTNCNVIWYDATPFAYGDGETVQIPDTYLDGIAPYMRQAGHDAYDPSADWDGDGADNYSEYVAGTNPFDPSDILSIRDFRTAGGENLVVFEYVGGHLYTLRAAESLARPDWMEVPFRTAPGAAEQKAAVFRDSDGEAGLATLYATPASDAPVRFYQVEVK